MRFSLFDELTKKRLAPMFLAAMSETEKFKTVGQIIQDRLDHHGWTQQILALVSGIDYQVINRIVNGKKSLSAEQAIQIGEVLGVSAERLLSIQNSFELAQARIVFMPDEKREIRANLFGRLPIAEMIARGWIAADDIRDSRVEPELAKFFNSSSPEEIEFMPHAAKKTDVSSPATPVQLAWLFRVKQIASELLVARYSPAAVKSAVEKLVTLRASPEAIRKVPRILAEAGIRFVIVETLKSAKMDGVCFWLDEKSPVIGMSLRHDRIDNFWFVLRHELEHVIRLHGKDAMMVDAELEGEKAGTGADIPEEEKVANQAGADFCVPKKSMDSFIARKGPTFSERDLIGFSKTLGIHPGIAAGQLRFRTGRYELFSRHLEKVRTIVSPGAAVDGWGDIYPVGV